MNFRCFSLEWLLNCYSCVDSHRILITPDKSAIWRQWQKRILTTIRQHEMEENWWYADIRCAHMMICPMSTICRALFVLHVSHRQMPQCAYCVRQSVHLLVHHCGMKFEIFLNIPILCCTLDSWHFGLGPPFSPHKS